MTSRHRCWSVRRHPLPTRLETPDYAQDEAEIAIVEEGVVREIWLRALKPISHRQSVWDGSRLVSSCGTIEYSLTIASIMRVLLWGPDVPVRVPRGHSTQSLANEASTLPYCRITIEHCLVGKDD